MTIVNEKSIVRRSGRVDTRIVLLTIARKTHLKQDRTHITELFNLALSFTYNHNYRDLYFRSHFYLSKVPFQRRNQDECQGFTTINLYPASKDRQHGRSFQPISSSRPVQQNCKKYCTSSTSTATSTLLVWNSIRWTNGSYPPSEKPCLLLLQQAVGHQVR